MIATPSDVAGILELGYGVSLLVAGSFLRNGAGWSENSSRSSGDSEADAAQTALQSPLPEEDIMEEDTPENFQMVSYLWPH